MNEAPPTEEKKSVWQLLEEQPRPTKRIAFMRKRFDGVPVPELAMRVLTQQEAMGAAIAAEKAARAQMKTAERGQLSYDEFYARAVCVETLFRACVEVDDERRGAWPTPELLRQQLTTEECATLLELYTGVQDDLTAEPFRVVGLTAMDPRTLLERATSLRDDLPAYVLDLAAQGGTSADPAIASSARTQLSALLGALRGLRDQLVSYQPLLEQLTEHEKELLEATE